MTKARSTGLKLRHVFTTCLFVLAFQFSFVSFAATVPNCPALISAESFQKHLDKGLPGVETLLQHPAEVLQQSALALSPADQLELVRTWPEAFLYFQRRLLERLTAPLSDAAADEKITVPKINDNWSEWLVTETLQSPLYTEMRNFLELPPVEMHPQLSTLSPEQLSLRAKGWIDASGPAMHWSSPFYHIEWLKKAGCGPASTEKWLTNSSCLAMLRSLYGAMTEAWLLAPQPGVIPGSAIRVAGTYHADAWRVSFHEGNLVIETMIEIKPSIVRFHSKGMYQIHGFLHRLLKAPNTIKLFGKSVLDKKIRIRTLHGLLTLDQLKTVLGDSHFNARGIHLDDKNIPVISYDGRWNGFRDVFQATFDPSFFEAILPKDEVPFVASHLMHLPNKPVGVQTPGLLTLGKNRSDFGRFVATVFGDPELADLVTRSIFLKEIQDHRDLQSHTVIPGTSIYTPEPTEEQVTNLDPRIKEKRYGEILEEAQNREQGYALLNEARHKEKREFLEKVLMPYAGWRTILAAPGLYRSLSLTDHSLKIESYGSMKPLLIVWDQTGKVREPVFDEIRNKQDIYTLRVPAGYTWPNAKACEAFFTAELANHDLQHFTTTEWIENQRALLGEFRIQLKLGQKEFLQMLHEDFATNPNSIWKKLMQGPVAYGKTLMLILVLKELVQRIAESPDNNVLIVVTSQKKLAEQISTELQHKRVNDISEPVDFLHVSWESGETRKEIESIAELLKVARQERTKNRAVVVTVNWAYLSGKINKATEAEIKELQEMFGGLLIDEADQVSGGNLKTAKKLTDGLDKISIFGMEAVLVNPEAIGFFNNDIWRVYDTDIETTDPIEASLAQMKRGVELGEISSLRSMKKEGQDDEEIILHFTPEALVGNTRLPEGLVPTDIYRKLPEEAQSVLYAQLAKNIFGTMQRHDGIIRVDTQQQATDLAKYLQGYWDNACKHDKTLEPKVIKPYFDGSPDHDEVYAGLQKAEGEGRVHWVVAVQQFDGGLNIPHLSGGILLTENIDPVVFLEFVGRFLRLYPGKLPAEIIQVSKRPTVSRDLLKWLEKKRQRLQNRMLAGILPVGNILAVGEGEDGDTSPAGSADSADSNPQVTDDKNKKGNDFPTPEDAVTQRQIEEKHSVSLFPKGGSLPQGENGDRTRSSGPKSTVTFPQGRVPVSGITSADQELVRQLILLLAETSKEKWLLAQTVEKKKERTPAEREAFWSSYQILQVNSLTQILEELNASALPADLIRLVNRMITDLGPQSEHLPFYSELLQWRFPVLKSLRFIATRQSVEGAQEENWNDTLMKFTDSLLSEMGEISFIDRYDVEVPLDFEQNWKKMMASETLATWPITRAEAADRLLALKAVWSEALLGEMPQGTPPDALAQATGKLSALTHELLLIKARIVRRNNSQSLAEADKKMIAETSSAALRRLESLGRAFAALFPNDSFFAIPMGTSDLFLRALNDSDLGLLYLDRMLSLFILKLTNDYRDLDLAAHFTASGSVLTILDAKTDSPSLVKAIKRDSQQMLESAQQRRSKDRPLSREEAEKILAKWAGSHGVIDAQLSDGEFFQEASRRMLEWKKLIIEFCEGAGPLPPLYRGSAATIFAEDAEEVRPQHLSASVLPTLAGYRREKALRLLMKRLTWELSDAKTAMVEARYQSLPTPAAKEQFLEALETTENSIRSELARGFEDLLGKSNLISSVLRGVTQEDHKLLILREQLVLRARYTLQYESPLIFGTAIEFKSTQSEPFLASENAERFLEQLLGYSPEASSLAALSIRENNYQNIETILGPSLGRAPDGHLLDALPENLSERLQSFSLQVMKAQRTANLDHLSSMESEQVLAHFEKVASLLRRLVVLQARAESLRHQWLKNPVMELPLYSELRKETSALFQDVSQTFLPDFTFVNGMLHLDSAFEGTNGNHLMRKCIALDVALKSLRNEFRAQHGLGALLDIELPVYRLLKTALKSGQTTQFLESIDKLIVKLDGKKNEVRDEAKAEAEQLFGSVFGRLPLKNPATITDMLEEAKAFQRLLAAHLEAGSFDPEWLTLPIHGRDAAILFYTSVVRPATELPPDAKTALGLVGLGQSAEVALGYGTLFHFQPVLPLGWRVQLAASENYYDEEMGPENLVSKIIRKSRVENEDDFANARALLSILDSHFPTWRDAGDDSEAGEAALTAVAQAVTHFDPDTLTMVPQNVGDKKQKVAASAAAGNTDPPGPSISNPFADAIVYPQGVLPASGTVAPNPTEQLHLSLIQLFAEFSVRKQELVKTEFALRERNGMDPEGKARFWSAYHSMQSHQLNKILAGLRPLPKMMDALLRQLRDAIWSDSTQENKLISLFLAQLQFHYPILKEINFLEPLPGPPREFVRDPLEQIPNLVAGSPWDWMALSVTLGPDLVTPFAASFDVAFSADFAERWNVIVAEEKTMPWPLEREDAEITLNRLRARWSDMFLGDMPTGRPVEALPLAAGKLWGQLLHAKINAARNYRILKERAPKGEKWESGEYTDSGLRQLRVLYDAFKGLLAGDSYFENEIFNSVPYERAESAPASLESAGYLKIALEQLLEHVQRHYPSLAESMVGSDHLTLMQNLESQKSSAEIKKDMQSIIEAASQQSRKRTLKRKAAQVVLENWVGLHGNLNHLSDSDFFPEAAKSAKQIRTEALAFLDGTEPIPLDGNFNTLAAEIFPRSEPGLPLHLDSEALAKLQGDERQKALRQLIVRLRLELSSSKTVSVQSALDALSDVKERERLLSALGQVEHITRTELIRGFDALLGAGNAISVTMEEAREFTDWKSLEIRESTYTTLRTRLGALSESFRTPLKTLYVNAGTWVKDEQSEPAGVNKVLNRIFGYELPANVMAKVVPKLLDLKGAERNSVVSLDNIESTLEGILAFAETGSRSMDLPEDMEAALADVSAAGIKKLATQSRAYLEGLVSTGDEQKLNEIGLLIRRAVYLQEKSETLSIYWGRANLSSTSAGEVVDLKRTIQKMLEQLRPEVLALAADFAKFFPDTPIFKGISEILKEFSEFPTGVATIEFPRLSAVVTMMARDWVAACGLHAFSDVLTPQFQLYKTLVQEKTQVFLKDLAAAREGSRDFLDAVGLNSSVSAQSGAKKKAQAMRLVDGARGGVFLLEDLTYAVSGKDWMRVLHATSSLQSDTSSNAQKLFGITSLTRIAIEKFKESECPAKGVSLPFHWQKQANSVVDFFANCWAPNNSIWFGMQSALNKPTELERAEAVLKFLDSSLPELNQEETPQSIQALEASAEAFVKASQTAAAPAALEGGTPTADSLGKKSHTKEFADAYSSAKFTRQDWERRFAGTQFAETDSSLEQIEFFLTLYASLFPDNADLEKVRQKDFKVLQNGELAPEVRAALDAIDSSLEPETQRQVIYYEMPLLVKHISELEKEERAKLVRNLKQDIQQLDQWIHKPPKDWEDIMLRLQSLKTDSNMWELTSAVTPASYKTAAEKMLAIAAYFDEPTKHSFLSEKFYRKQLDYQAPLKSFSSLVLSLLNFRSFESGMDEAREIKIVRATKFHLDRMLKQIGNLDLDISAGERISVAYLALENANHLMTDFDAFPRQVLAEIKTQFLNRFPIFEPEFIRIRGLMDAGQHNNLKQNTDLARLALYFPHSLPTLRAAFPIDSAEAQKRVTQVNGVFPDFYRPSIPEMDVKTQYVQMMKSIRTRLYSLDLKSRRIQFAHFYYSEEDQREIISTQVPELVKEFRTTIRALSLLIPQDPFFTDLLLRLENPEAQANLVGRSNLHLQVRAYLDRVYPQFVSEIVEPTKVTLVRDALLQEPNAYFTELRAEIASLNVPNNPGGPSLLTSEQVKAILKEEDKDHIRNKRKRKIAALEIVLEFAERYRKVSEPLRPEETALVAESLWPYGIVTVGEEGDVESIEPGKVSADLELDSLDSALKTPSDAKYEKGLKALEKLAGLIGMEQIDKLRGSSDFNKAMGILADELQEVSEDLSQSFEASLFLEGLSDTPKKIRSINFSHFNEALGHFLGIRTLVFAFLPSKYNLEPEIPPRLFAEDVAGYLSLSRLKFAERWPLSDESVQATIDAVGTLLDDKKEEGLSNQQMYSHLVRHAFLELMAAILDAKRLKALSGSGVATGNLSGGVTNVEKRFKGSVQIYSLLVPEDPFFAAVLNTLHTSTVGVGPEDGLVIVSAKIEATLSHVQDAYPFLTLIAKPTPLFTTLKTVTDGGAELQAVLVGEREKLISWNKPGARRSRVRSQVATLTVLNQVITEEGPDNTLIENDSPCKNYIQIVDNLIQGIGDYFAQDVYFKTSSIVTMMDDLKNTEIFQTPESQP